jgi:PIN domain nuclease of toxin-antitoxin system
VSAEHGVVIDASARLALLGSEPGAEHVEQALDGAAMTTVNWSEVFKRWLAHRVDVEQLRTNVQSLGVTLVDFSADDAERAAEFSIPTRHLGLSLGDRACLALADRLGRPALTADRTWLDLDLCVEIKAIR